MKKQLSFDIQQYHRRLLLATYFRFEEGSDPPPFTHKSAWMPKLSQVPNTVRKIIRADKYAIKNLPWNHREHANLNVEEQQALLQLRRDNSIVIKPADKGSATVIMDREAYIKEAERQLNQEEYYKKLPEPIFLETVPLVRTILTQLREGGHINKKQETYLIGPDNPRQRFFYLLPKIHKSPESWSVPYEMPPGRPIVSDCGSETYATAEYIEHFLNPISTRHPSYIKDTYDFIDKIKNITLPQECLLFTIDIDSLYTNIETITTYLSGVVKPANPTNLTKTLLDGNARNWAYTTRLILIEHYETHIAQEVKSLRDGDLGDGMAALGVATKWYRLKYPKKHAEGPVKRVETLLRTLGDRVVGGGEDQGDGGAVQEGLLFTEEDFPPLPRREEASSGHSSPWGPTPFPMTPPPLPPREPKENRIRRSEHKRDTNPVVISTENHPELLQIGMYPNTQEASSPPTRELRVEASISSPALVEVHAENATTPQSEVTDQDPHLVLVEESPVTPVTPVRGIESGRGDEILSPVDPLARVPREEMETSLLPDPPMEPLKSVETFRPVRHSITTRKLTEWSLSARKPICILGDSNLSRITTHPYKEVQIDSYPGGTFRHAESIIQKATIHVKVQAVILAFGINHRCQKSKETAIKQLQRAIKATVDKFPGAAVWIPLINFSTTLKRAEQETLTCLNGHIKKNMPFIPLLPTAQFDVSPDKIHWTAPCARAMLEHWANRLNFVGL
ncbi:hypothetical protein MHYP_G00130480 [Metynnis hypsauchen]